MITKQSVAEKIGSWLRHEISEADLVDWAEEAIRDGEFAEMDAGELAAVVGRLGLADVKEFGLSWGDCEALLHQLGYTVKVEITAA
jgi:hypothetical protein